MQHFIHCPGVGAELCFLPVEEKNKLVRKRASIGSIRKSVNFVLVTAAELRVEHLQVINTSRGHTVFLGGGIWGNMCH